MGQPLEILLVDLDLRGAAVAQLLEKFLEEQVALLLGQVGLDAVLHGLEWGRLGQVPAQDLQHKEACVRVEGPLEGTHRPLPEGPGYLAVPLQGLVAVVEGDELLHQRQGVLAGLEPLEHLLALLGAGHVHAPHLHQGRQGVAVLAFLKVDPHRVGVGLGDLGGHLGL